MPRAVEVQSKDLTLFRTQGGLSGGFVEKPILKMKQVCPISKLVLNTKALMESEEGSRQIKQKPKQRLTPMPPPRPSLGVVSPGSSRGDPRLGGPHLLRTLTAPPPAVWVGAHFRLDKV